MRWKTGMRKSALSSPRSSATFRGAIPGYRGSRPLRARCRGGRSGVGKPLDNVQCYNGSGYGHMVGQCPSYNSRRATDREALFPPPGSYEREQVNGRCPRISHVPVCFPHRCHQLPHSPPLGNPLFSNRPTLLLVLPLVLLLFLPSPRNQNGCSTTPSVGISASGDPRASNARQSPCISKPIITRCR